MFVEAHESFVGRMREADGTDRFAFLMHSFYLLLPKLISHPALTGRTKHFHLRDILSGDTLSKCFYCVFYVGETKVKFCMCCLLADGGR